MKHYDTFQLMSQKKWVLPQAWQCPNEVFVLFPQEKHLKFGKQKWRKIRANEYWKNISSSLLSSSENWKDGMMLLMDPFRAMIMPESSIFRQNFSTIGLSFMKNYIYKFFIFLHLNEN